MSELIVNRMHLVRTILQLSEKMQKRANLVRTAKGVNIENCILLELIAGENALFGDN